MIGDKMAIQVSCVDDLGSVIKEQRKIQGLTQVQSSRKAGVGHRFYGELENGKPTVRFESVLKVLDSLGLELQVVVPSQKIDQVEYD